MLVKNLPISSMKDIKSFALGGENSCAESLVQFPPTPPSALIGRYKDRCDGLFQYGYLPIVAASTLAQIRVSRGQEIDRFLVQSYTFTTGESRCKADIASGSENNREEALCIYSRVRCMHHLCWWYLLQLAR